MVASFTQILARLSEVGRYLRGIFQIRDYSEAHDCDNDKREHMLNIGREFLLKPYVAFF